MDGTAGLESKNGAGKDHHTRWVAGKTEIAHAKGVFSTGYSSVNTGLKGGEAPQSDIPALCTVHTTLHNCFLYATILNRNL